MWDSLHEEFRSATRELSIAEHHFNQAEPEFIDVAIEGLNLARAKFAYVLRKMKALKEVGA